LQLHKAGGAGTLILSSDLTDTNNAMGKIAFGSTGITGAEERTALIVSTKRDAVTTVPLGSLEFYTANGAIPAERMRIDNRGYVGIGTTAPDSHLTLQVGASGGVQNMFSLFNVDGAPRCIFKYDTDAVKFQFTDRNGGPILGWTENGGIGSVVGIGTTSPGAALDIRAVTTSPLYVQAQPTVGATAIAALVVNGAGNVGIGRVGPTAQLHVYGVTDNVAFEVQASSSNASGVNSVNVGLYVDKRGNVGIGTIAPSQRLEVSGIVSANGIISNATITANAGTMMLTPLSSTPNGTSAEGTMFYNSVSKKLWTCAQGGGCSTSAGWQSAW
jgi:hypothetical protein